MAPILRVGNGLRMHYLPLPADIAEAWQAEGVRRVVGTLNDYPVRRGIQGRFDGERFVLLGQALLREIGAVEGDIVVAVLEPDPDPEHINLGEELEAALDQDEAAAERFYGMTPGRQRSLAYYVTSAKRTETRIKRALELAYKLRTHTLYGDLHGER